ncbi:hypothetical protein EDB85DRAFT_2146081 [Lactarius pseudohatsudake]|nr:hypothetical protein EDB85DRAFT_2146081 [Lactarius pseudohatsudake]
MRACGSTNVPTNIDRQEAKQRKPLTTRLRHVALPPATAPMHKKPAPYPPSLTPLPSRRHPHCVARDRLRMWLPIPTQLTPADAAALSPAEQERIKDTMVHAWEEDTREAYSSGLLLWHVYCDDKGTSELARAPASQALLSTFVAHMAAAYSGKTISNYLNGVHAWHVLHSIPWALNKNEMDTMLCAASKLAPDSLKRKKHKPYTPDFIVAVWQHLNMKDLLDAAVFACLITCFYASTRREDNLDPQIQALHLCENKKSHNSHTSDFSIETLIP